MHNNRKIAVRHYIQSDEFYISSVIHRKIFQSLCVIFHTWANHFSAVKEANKPRTKRNTKHCHIIHDTLCILMTISAPTILPEKYRLFARDGKQRNTDSQKYYTASGHSNHKWVLYVTWTEGMGVVLVNGYVYAKGLNNTPSCDINQMTCL